MRVNTTRSMEVGRIVKERFGTWQEVRRAAKRVRGVYVIETMPNAKVIEERKPVDA